MKTKNTKAVYSVKDTFEALQLSRARYYQLLKAGILPHPLYDIRTKRPFYTFDMFEICLEVKKTCVGVNGDYILFYTSRRKPQRNAGKPLKQIRHLHQDVIEMLSGMGLDVSEKDVNAAIKELYPKGIKECEIGVAVREIFRFFKRKSV